MLENAFEYTGVESNYSTIAEGTVEGPPRSNELTRLRGAMRDAGNRDD